MLLRQGEADRLLSVRPADRFEVLAGVVGLDRYQRLDERASNHCKTARAETETLQSQLNGLPPVAEDELRRADEQATTARATVEHAVGRIESLHTLHAQAVQWTDLQGRLRDARAKREGYARVVQRAQEIDAGWRRLSDLRGVLPPLTRVHQQRQRLDASRRLAATLAWQRQQKQQDAAFAAAALQESRQECEALEQAVEAGQVRERELDRRRAELEHTLAAAAPYERHQRDADAVGREIGSLPTNPAADLRKAQETCDGLAAAHAALPALRRLADHRAAQATAADVLRRTREALHLHAGEVREAEAGRAEAQRHVEVAVAALQAGTERQARVAAAVDADRNALAAVQQTAGQAQCPACGQPLTDEHRGSEERRRRGQLEQSTAELRDAQTQRRSADAECGRRRQALAEAEARCRAAEVRGRDLAHAEQQAGRDFGRCGSECRRAYAELPDPLRLRVRPEPPAGDDWAGTPWPTTEDLADLARSAATLAQARRELAQAQKIYDRWKELTAKVQFLAEALAARPADLPCDLKGVRDELGHVKGDPDAVGGALKSRRDEWGRRRVEHQRLAEQQQRLQSEIGALDRQLGQEQVAQQHLEADIEQTMTCLAPDWVASAAELTMESLGEHLLSWQREAQALEVSGVERDHDALGQAREQVDRLDGRIAEWAADADRLPTEARQDPVEVATLLEQARDARQQQEVVAREAQRWRDGLYDRRRQRDELHRRHCAADRRHRNYKLLAELLGRNGLQMDLIRRAERAVVEYARHTLDRLSGGDLMLQLRSGADDVGGAANQALDLEVIPVRSGTARPVPVNLLSGSQKFRVAVSLALAIGQYAGGRYRCGECVIIDEGFGSLDKAGQDVMIQELHNLKGLLKRIVLVSHQDAFAEAFSEGYRFRLEDGQTRVERVG